MLLYSIENIERLFIEITANCNALCPGCMRTNKGRGGLNPIVEQHLGRIGNMTLETFNNAVHDDLFKQAKRFDLIEFNGTVGDAIMNPQFIDFLKLVNDKNDLYRKDNNRVAFRIATNAGLHDQAYWNSVADQILRGGDHGQVIVALDGVDNETHQQYRRGVDFDRALENAVTLIERGVKVQWQFIEFKHNSDQIPIAEKMAKDLGFYSIDIRNSRASQRETGAIANNSEYTDTKKVEAVVGKKEKVRSEKKFNVELKDNLVYKPNKQLEKLKKDIEKDISKFKDKKEYLQKSKIYCQWGNKGTVNIEFNGTVHPCCHFNNGFFVPQDSKNGYYSKVYQDYPEKWNSLQQHTITEILKNTWWNDLQNSWQPENTKKKFDRPSICTEICLQKDIVGDVKKIF